MARKPPIKVHDLLWEGNSETESLRQLVAACLRERNAKLSQLGEAFMADTGLLPQEMELVECREGTTTRWFYRRREGSARALEPEAALSMGSFWLCIRSIREALEEPERRADIIAAMAATARSRLILGELSDMLDDLTTILPNS